MTLYVGIVGSLLNNTDQTDQIMLIDFQLECM
jgi:hypothetical protein